MRIAVVYGGRSGEHEVSIESARSVIAAINAAKHEVVPICITQDGSWVAISPEALLAGPVKPARHILPSAEPSNLPQLSFHGETRVDSLAQQVDVVFPLVHGTFGEDGCLQGLFELAALPYVGSSVLASAVGMDKILMKAVFQANGLAVLDYLPLQRSDWDRSPSQIASEVAQRLGYPCFVKPSNLGSSVGISKVRTADELPAAITLAAEFSSRIIVERAVNAREIECGILGNAEPRASVVGEIFSSHDFYDYEAKYFDPTTHFEIPAQLDPELVTQVQSLAIRAFQAVGAAGLGRVDFFLDRDSGAIYVNEINSIPGFTKMSVYPRLWEASGVSYADLIETLIDLALARHADEARNRTHFGD